MPRPPADPYAPPPLKKDKRGPILRIAILAGLLGAAGVGYAALSAQHPQTAQLGQPADQQLADNSDTQVYQTAPQAAPAPEATPAAPAPAPAPTPAPARRTSSSRPAPVDTPQETTPAPTMSTTPTPAPVDPLTPPTPLPPTG